MNLNVLLSRCKPMPIFLIAFWNVYSIVFSKINLYSKFSILFISFRHSFNVLRTIVSKSFGRIFNFVVRFKRRLNNKSKYRTNVVIYNIIYIFLYKPRALGLVPRLTDNPVLDTYTYEVCYQHNFLVYTFYYCSCGRSMKITGKNQELKPAVMSIFRTQLGPPIRGVNLIINALFEKKFYGCFLYYFT